MIDKSFIVRKEILFLLTLLLISVSINTIGQTQKAEGRQLDIKHIESESVQSYKIKENQQLIDEFNNIPNFGIFHDTYFLTGVPTNKRIDNASADAKFQISFYQKLSKNLGFLNTSLMLTYTQKSFWDVYLSSSPFSENNYNPALILVKPIVAQNTIKWIGILSVEHESNGRDSIFSRSCNFIALSGVYNWNKNIHIQAKIWGGSVSKENKDLFHYRGHGLFAVNYKSSNDRLWISGVITPRDNFRSYNTILEINIRPRKASNQFIFMQWYNGYAENLVDYKLYTSMARFGICMKPLRMSYY